MEPVSSSCILVFIQGTNCLINFVHFSQIVEQLWMDFLSQLKKTTLSLLRQNIASNFSYVYRHFGQRDLRHFFFNYFSKYYCLTFFIRITRVFWPIWPPCWGPWKADVLSIGNSHEQTQWNRVCCLMLNFVRSLFFWGTPFGQIILKFIFPDWCIISFADFFWFLIF